MGTFEIRKPIFLIHSDKGLNYILGEDWLDFFDVTVVSARKPYFFSEDSSPFRVYDPDVDARLWDRVSSLEKGKIYYGGTIKQFQDMTGWKGENVLYFGDHPYSDLADVTLHHGWRTGAIIKELEVLEI
jgi:HAD superfamily 5'-nucleotidase-like hydrolase